MRAFLPVAAAVLLAGGASAAGEAGGTLATAVAVKVVVPGQQPALAAEVAAPPDAAGLGQSYAYPADGSVVQTGGVATSAQSDSGPTSTASASADVNELSLFGGEIGATLVSAHAMASAGPLTAAGNTDGSLIENLVVLGATVVPTPDLRVPLGDWGYAIVLGRTAGSAGTGERPGWRAASAVLDVHLTAPHGPLPAGSEIVVGDAEAAAQGTPPPDVQVAAPSTVGVLTPAPEPQPSAPPAAPRQARPPEPPSNTVVPPLTIRRPPSYVHPQLTAGRYVFPVYGQVAFTDTFGAPRADVSYHHGDDIFAPLGAPILAVADGRLSSVGWNEVGGNRLWLQDGQGNQFYYAHLSAFASAAREGAFVRAGAVLGFVGATGDAAGTPSHLHFELHPVSLLYLGYDGAVDPTPYLGAWQHLRDVSFTTAQGWVPAARTSSPAPRPGAVLLAMSDISAASGLVPGALQRAAVAPVSSEGDGGLVRAASFGS